MEGKGRQGREGREGKKGKEGKGNLVRKGKEIIRGVSYPRQKCAMSTHCVSAVDDANKDVFP